MVCIQEVFNTAYFMEWFILEKYLNQHFEPRKRRRLREQQLTLMLELITAFLLYVIPSWDRTEVTPVLVDRIHFTSIPEGKQFYLNNR